MPSDFPPLYSLPPPPPLSLFLSLPPPPLSPLSLSPPPPPLSLSVSVSFSLCWLLNVPATWKCISGSKLLRQYLAPHWYRSCWSKLVFLPVIMYWHKNRPPSTKPIDRLVGLVVKASASRAQDPGSESRLRQDFSGPGSSHTSDLKIGTPVATLPGAWRYRASAGTGWPGVSILWLGEMESWICNFYLSVAARKFVWADPSRRCTRMLLGR